MSQTCCSVGLRLSVRAAVMREINSSSLLFKNHFIQFIWKRERAHLLVHFQNACDSQGPIRQKPGTRNASHVSHGVAETQLLSWHHRQKLNQLPRVYTRRELASGVEPELKPMRSDVECEHLSTVPDTFLLRNLPQEPWPLLCPPQCCFRCVLWCNGSWCSYRLPEKMTIPGGLWIWALLGWTHAGVSAAGSLG